MNEGSGVSDRRQRLLLDTCRGSGLLTSSWGEAPTPSYCLRVGASSLSKQWITHTLLLRGHF
jgi:hypothetical protein